MANSINLGFDVDTSALSQASSAVTNMVKQLVENVAGIDLDPLVGGFTAINAELSTTRTNIEAAFGSSSTSVTAITTALTALRSSLSGYEADVTRLEGLQLAGPLSSADLATLTTARTEVARLKEEIGKKEGEAGVFKDQEKAALNIVKALEKQSKKVQQLQKDFDNAKKKASKGDPRAIQDMVRIQQQLQQESDTATATQERLGELVTSIGASGGAVSAEVEAVVQQAHNTSAALNKELTEVVSNVNSLGPQFAAALSNVNGDQLSSSVQKVSSTFSGMSGVMSGVSADTEAFASTLTSSFGGGINTIKSVNASMSALGITTGMSLSKAAVQGWGAMTTGASAFLTSIGPVGWAIIAVTAAMTALYVLWQRNEKMVQRTHEEEMRRHKDNLEAYKREADMRAKLNSMVNEHAMVQLKLAVDYSELQSLEGKQIHAQMELDTRNYQDKVLQMERERLDAAEDTEKQIAEIRRTTENQLAKIGSGAANDRKKEALKQIMEERIARVESAQSANNSLLEQQQKRLEMEFRNEQEHQKRLIGLSEKRDNAEMEMNQAIDKIKRTREEQRKQVAPESLTSFDTATTNLIIQERAKFMAQFNKDLEENRKKASALEKEVGDLAVKVNIDPTARKQAEEELKLLEKQRDALETSGATEGPGWSPEELKELKSKRTWSEYFGGYDDYRSAAGGRMDRNRRVTSEFAASKSRVSGEEFASERITPYTQAEIKADTQFRKTMGKDGAEQRQKALDENQKAIDKIKTTLASMPTIDPIDQTRLGKAQAALGDLRRKIAEAELKGSADVDVLKAQQANLEFDVVVEEDLEKELANLRVKSTAKIQELQKALTIPGISVDEKKSIENQIKAEEAMLKVSEEMAELRATNKRTDTPAKNKKTEAELNELEQTKILDIKFKTDTANALDDIKRIERIAKQDIKIRLSVDTARLDVEMSQAWSQTEKDIMAKQKKLLEDTAAFEIKQAGDLATAQARPDWAENEATFKQQQASEKAAYDARAQNAQKYYDEALNAAQQAGRDQRAAQTDAVVAQARAKYDRNPLAAQNAKEDIAHSKKIYEKRLEHAKEYARQSAILAEATEKGTEARDNDGTLITNESLFDLQERQRQWEELLAVDKDAQQRIRQQIYDIQMEAKNRIIDLEYDVKLKTHEATLGGSKFDKTMAQERLKEEKKIAKVRETDLAHYAKVQEAVARDTIAHMENGVMVGAQVNGEWVDEEYLYRLNKEMELAKAKDKASLDYWEKEKRRIHEATVEAREAQANMENKQSIDSRKAQSSQRINLAKAWASGDGRQVLQAQGSAAIESQALAAQQQAERDYQKRIADINKNANIKDPEERQRLLNEAQRNYETEKADIDIKQNEASAYQDLMWQLRDQIKAPTKENLTGSYDRINEALNKRADDPNTILLRQQYETQQQMLMYQIMVAQAMGVVVKKPGGMSE
jgi:hypothetical protein